MELASRDQMPAELPSSVKKANSMIFLFGLLLVVNALSYGIRFGLWLRFVQSLGFLFVAILIGGSLLMKKPRAWWIAVLASSLVFIRCMIGLPAWFGMRAEGRVLDVQLPIFYAAGLILSSLAIILLMQPDCRAYFKRNEKTV